VKSRLLAIAALTGTLLVSGPAWAHGVGDARAKLNASELEPGPVKRLILDVQKQVRDGKHEATLVEHPIDEAIRAADRARSARAAGDRPHSGMLDKLAEQWAKVGSVVLRAVDTEKSARVDAQRLAELTIKVERAQALLTEQQARLGRLDAELEKAEQTLDAAAKKSANKETKRVAPRKKKKGKAK
jgi:hypothetical protein